MTNAFSKVVHRLQTSNTDAGGMVQLCRKS